MSAPVSTQVIGSRVQYQRKGYTLTALGSAGTSGIDYVPDEVCGADVVNASGVGSGSNPVDLVIASCASQSGIGKKFTNVPYASSLTTGSWTPLSASANFAT